MHGGDEAASALNVVAAADRPIFPPDRDCEDHVFCILEFPAPGYDPKDRFASRKKIAVQYSSINGNGFGGYGEIVYGTKGTLILEREQEMMLFPAVRPTGDQGFQQQGGRSDDGHPGQRRRRRRASTIKVSGGGPTMDTQASGRRGKRRQPRLRRGAGALGLVHPQPGAGEPAALPSQGGHGRRRDRPDDQHGRPAGPPHRVPRGMVRHRQRRNPRGVAPEHQSTTSRAKIIVDLRLEHL